MAACRTSPCRRSRDRVAAARACGSAPDLQPEVATPEIIEASGIRWIHIESPRTSDRDWLEANFDFHPLDFEDVYSRNNRPKLDQYDDYVFIVLHFPLYEKETSPDPDRGAGPVHGPGLPDHPPEHPAPAADRDVRALPREGGPARGDVLEGHRLPALQDRRHLRRRVVPDAAQDEHQARPHRGRHLRGAVGARSSATSPRRSRRSSTSGASSGRSAPSCATSSARSSATSRRSWRSTSTTSPTRPSGSGTRSRTTRRSSRRSSRPTSRCCRTA